MRLEIRKRGQGPVPGADPHALFTAEAPAAPGADRRQIRRERIVRFDGKIRNAPAGIPCGVRTQGSRRAGLHAGTARPARHRGKRGMRREAFRRYVADDHADQNPETEIRRNEEVILSDEAQSGFHRPIALQHGCAVDERPPGESREKTPQFFHHPEQPVLDDTVIVRSLGETGHTAGCRSVGRQKAEHAFRPRNQQRRIHPFVPVPGEVVHAAVSPFFHKRRIDPDMTFGNRCGLCRTEIQKSVFPFIYFY